MRRAGGRAAVVLLVAALAAAVALGIWLARLAGDEATAARSHSRQTEGDPSPPPAPPTFAVEPLADGTELAATGGEPGSAAAPPAAASGEAAAPLRAVVVFADGTPAAGATVVAAAGDGVIDTQITGADGAASFSITDGKVELYVAGATPKPQRFDIEPAQGEHRLELAAGAFVGGVVLIDGAPPAEPIGLVLHSKDGEPVFDAPWRVRLALATVDSFWDQEIGQHTTEGRFRFGGLAPDWSGSIQFPAWFRLEGGGAYDFFRVDRPATDLVLRLTWDGALSGRLLLPAAGSDEQQPAASARVEFELEMREVSRSGSQEADEEGRFRIPIHSDSPAKGRLRFRAADGTARGSREFEAVDPIAGRDFGEIVLETTQRAEFLAIDEDGQPVAGAVATANDDTHARSKPTDETGHGVLPDLRPGTSSIRVDALGFHPAVLPLSSDMVARLMPAPLLELQLVDALDGSPGTTVVHLRCFDALFECDDCNGIDPIQVDLGATSFLESRVESGAKFKLFEGKASARGHCLFTRIRPGVSFTVGLSDVYGTELRPPEDMLLGPREQRRLQWRVDSPGRTVIVRALATDGTPVPGAEVSLHQAGTNLDERDWQGVYTTRTSGEAGEAQFKDVFAPRVSVQVARDGYGTAWLADRVVPAEGATFELRLAPGRTVTVEVVDAAGAPRDVSSVLLDGAPRPVTARHAGLGLYRLDDAPAGEITIRAELMRRSYRASVAANGTTAHISIPALGTISARWTVPLEPDQDHTVLVRGIDADAWSTYGWIGDEARVTGGPITIKDVTPGDYEVVLRRGPGWTGDNPPVSQVARVTVKAGEVSEVLLEP